MHSFNHHWFVQAFLPSSTLGPRPAFAGAPGSGRARQPSSASRGFFNGNSLVLASVFAFGLAPHDGEGLRNPVLKCLPRASRFTPAFRAIAINLSVARKRGARRLARILGLLGSAPNGWTGGAR